MKPLCLAAAVLCLASCAPPEGGAPLRVVVSIPPQEFVLARVGGPGVAVTVLAGPGESPHTYQPSDSQVSDVMRARLYFRIGVPFENGRWLSALPERVRVVDQRAGIDLRRMEEEESTHGHDEGDDPHVWLTPRHLRRMAENAAGALLAADPERAATYEANLRALCADLDRTDEALRRLLAPVRGRAMYVFHPAWGYFCDEYGLRQVSVEFEGKEPSDHELTALIARARADRARVIFVQPQVSGRSAAALAEATGATLRTLDPLRVDVLANLTEAATAVAEALR